MIIIGIAGPSCSGKSTISKMLAKDLDASLISLDDFYIKRSKEERIYVEDDEGKLVRTNERPENYDGSYVANEIKKLIEGKTVSLKKFDWETKRPVFDEVKPCKILLIEGFLLFLYPELEKLITYRFFIDIPLDLMIKRRESRVRVAKYDSIFRKIGLSETKKYCLTQKEDHSLIILDGQESSEELCEKIKSRLTL